MQEVILKDFLKVSTNKIYESKSWHYRNGIKKDYLKWFLAYKNSFTPVEPPIHLEFDFRFSRNALDCSNVSFSAKMMEDCLVHYGILKDDSPKFVKSVKYSSAKSDNKETYCILKIIEV